MLPADTIDAVLHAIDSKLLGHDPLTLEELELVEKLTRARALLQEMRAAA